MVDGGASAKRQRRLFPWMTWVRLPVSTFMTSMNVGSKART